jgi:hypothetical protein
MRRPRKIAGPHTEGDATDFILYFGLAAASALADAGAQVTLAARTKTVAERYEVDRLGQKRATPLNGLLPLAIPSQ